jgi:hypothetical protein
LQCGFGDLGMHGGLPAGFVPHDLQVEALEELGFELGRQAGQDVAQHRLVEQGGVGCLGGGLGEGVQLGLDLLAFGVELGEPGPDPGPHRGGGGIAGIGGEFFQFQDAGVLAGLDPLEPGVQGRGLGVAFGGSSASAAGSWAARSDATSARSDAVTGYL